MDYLSCESGSTPKSATADSVRREGHSHSRTGRRVSTHQSFSCRATDSCHGQIRGWSPQSTPFKEISPATDSSSATPLATTAPTSMVSPVRKVPSWRAPSGLPTPFTASAARRRPANCSPVCCPCATTSACSARSTTRSPDNTSATHHKRSATPVLSPQHSISPTQRPQQCRKTGRPGSKPPAELHPVSKIAAPPASAEGTRYSTWLRAHSCQNPGVAGENGQFVYIGPPC